MQPATFLLFGGRKGSSGGGGRRAGVVRPDGRALVDDTGPFYPLGLTFMWSMQGIKYESAHYEANVEWAADKRFDFLRPLTEVDWSGNRRIDPTDPEWSDWADVLRHHLDFCYDAHGLRNEITLRGKGTSVDPIWLAQQAAMIVADGRTHKTILLEMENEYWNGGDPLEQLVAMAQEVQARVPNLIALSCPEATASGADLIKSTSLELGLQAMTRHTERDGGDYKWRQVRQGYDFKEDAPLVGWDGEPPGPGSSVDTNTSPLQLAMMRAVAIMCGAPVFVLHTGTGVYGDGKPGSNGVPRPPNFWEIENIDAIVDAVRGIDQLLPPGLPNWDVANTGWAAPNPVAPFQPKEMWEGDHGTGVNKAYAALAPDGRVIQMPCGVRGSVTLTASYPLTDVVVYDPLTRQPIAGVPTTFAQGASVSLPGGGQDAMVAYIIHGRRA